jgi:poly-gamma-glutamate capsule biosynthesis protein CapA/YwtB (metallophosphatase superfamily)
VDTDRVRRDAARAAELGADLVIVALHGGTEYRAEPTAQQRRHAEELLAEPAVDLVYGHHAHVVQPLQRLNGKWVAYGLGSMIAAHETPFPKPAKAGYSA